MPELRCPMCRRLADPKRRPFCSLHCADVDLGRWFTSQYRVPGQPDLEDEPDDSEPRQ